MTTSSTPKTAQSPADFATDPAAVAGAVAAAVAGDDDTMARRLAALGNPHRLKIYRLLVQAGPDGVTVGEIQRAMAMPASTLSHHLQGLRGAGLITQDRQGREVVTCADYGAMRDLVGYLTDACCTGVRLQRTDHAA